MFARQNHLTLSKGLTICDYMAISCYHFLSSSLCTLKWRSFTSVSSFISELMFCFQDNSSCYGQWLENDRGDFFLNLPIHKTFLLKISNRSLSSCLRIDSEK